MRRLLLSAVAAAAIGIPGAYADTTGYIGAGYGDTEYDGGDGFVTYQLNGAIQTDVNDTWSLQLDANTLTFRADSCCGNDSHGYAALHANADLGGWDVGGMVGLMNYFGSAGTMVGAEARTNLGDLSLQGSTAYAEFDAYYDFSGWNARVNGSYFLSPNFAINGGVNLIYFDWAFDNDEVTELSVGAAYQFGNSFELFGGYTNTSAESDVGSGWEADTFQFGLRFHINGGSLQDFTNDGASWTSGYLLSDAFVRW